MYVPKRWNSEVDFFSVNRWNNEMQWNRTDFLFTHGEQVNLHRIWYAFTHVFPNIKDEIWVIHALISEKKSFTPQYILYNVWDEITYPFLNFNSTTVEV